MDLGHIGHEKGRFSAILKFLSSAQNETYLIAFVYKRLKLSSNKIYKNFKYISLCAGISFTNECLF